MKKNYLLILSFFSAFALGQQQISFEASESYALGNIHGQNNWEVTLNSDEQPINGQTIVNEAGSQNSNALKIDVDVDEDYGWFPIYGAAKQLDAEVDYKTAVIEFDAYISMKEGSTFEFGSFGAAGDEFVPISTFSFNYTGNLEVVSSVDYDYESTGSIWEAGKWYRLKLETSDNDMKYYIDGNLVYTAPNFSKTNIQGIIFLHDNFDGFAYIDNITINNVAMSVNDVLKSPIKVYPNPVKSILNVDILSSEQIILTNIYNVAGQKMDATISKKQIYVDNLASGVYFLEVKTDKNKVYKSKFIKQ